jgi:hypothetical protein
MIKRGAIPLPYPRREKMSKQFFELNRQMAEIGGFEQQAYSSNFQAFEKHYDNGSWIQVMINPFTKADERVIVRGYIKEGDGKPKNNQNAQEFFNYEDAIETLNYYHSLMESIGNEQVWFSDEGGYEWWHHPSAMLSQAVAHNLNRSKWLGIYEATKLMLGIDGIAPKEREQLFAITNQAHGVSQGIQQAA